MAFLCTFSGLTLALLIWVGLYAIASNATIPSFGALASYLEAFSIRGQCLFAIHAVGFSWLTYRLLRNMALVRPRCSESPRVKRSAESDRGLVRPAWEHTTFAWRIQR